MIPSFKPGILSSNRIRAVASADVTPNAVSWCDLTFSGEYGAGREHAQQITGISTSITLRVELSNSNYSLYYKIDNFFTSCDIYLSSYNQFTLLSNNDTIIVQNNDYLRFYSGPGGGPATIATIKNTSDGNAILDTFEVGPEV